MNSIQVYPTLFSINYLDIIIVAFIPLWTMPMYAKFDKITFQRVVMTNIITLLGLIIVFVISYFFGDMFGPKLSPLIPDYVLNVPFQNYQTFSLLLGFILTFVVYYTYTSLKTNRGRHL
jgi:predicted histidine transporter YuiF (NhaC family)